MRCIQVPNAVKDDISPVIKKKKKKGVAHVRREVARDLRPMNLKINTYVDTKG